MTEQAVLVHRLHPAVRLLDRLIRREQYHELVPEARSGPLQRIRTVLVGRPLRTYVRTGKRAKQRRLIP